MDGRQAQEWEVGLMKAQLTRIVPLVLLAFLLAVANASAAKTGNPVTFPEPAGDAAGGLDITSITVDGTPATGSMTVTLTVPEFTPPVGDGKLRMLAVWLDTDKNGSTGSASGSEYSLLFVDDPADSEPWWDVDRWDGSGWKSLPDTASLDFGSRGDDFQWTLGRSDIGGATSFAFYAEARVVDAAGAVTRDEAPDESMKFSYEITGPRVMAIISAPTLGAPAPTRAVAGKRMTVSIPVSWTFGGKTVALQGAKMICDPSVNGKVVTHLESFDGKVARLTFVVPKAAKGKHLKVRVTIQGGTAAGGDVVNIDATSMFVSMAKSVYTGLSTTKIADFLVH
jgi:hypothetical protein